MKQHITIKTRFNENSVTVTFSDDSGAFIYITPAEMTERLTANKFVTYIDDGNHQGIVGTGRITLLHLTSENTHGTRQQPVSQYWMDTRHFMRVVKLNHDRYLAGLAAWKAAGKDDYKFKFPEIIMEVDAFSEVRVYGTPKTTHELLLHPNCCGGDTWTDTRKNFVHALATFRKSLVPEQRERFETDLAHYMDTAHVWGDYTGREFYFDGRHAALKSGRGGCGFNGAFILRNESFSIHT